MASNPPRTSTSRSNRDDVLQFLDSLDAYSGQPSTSATGSGPTTGLPRSTSTSSSLSQSQSQAQATRPPPGAASAPKSAQEAQSVLDFLDEITSKTTSPPPPSTRTTLDKKPTTPMRTTGSRTNLSQIASSSTQPPRRSTDSVRSQRSVPSSSTAADRASPASISRTLPSTSTSTASTATSTAAGASAPAAATATPPSQPQPAQTGGWGWSSVWSTASTAINQASQLAHQARTVAEEQVKANAGGLGEGLMKAWNHEGTGEDGSGVRKWTEGVQGLVKGANLEGLGKELKSTTLKSLTDLLNAVAPPIAEHEVIQVSLSHDMKGYDGVENLVYRGFSKIMDQIEGGTLMVNRAETGQVEQEATGGNDNEEERNLNVLDGLEAGWNLAQTTLDQLIATTYKPSTSNDQSDSVTVPVTNCPVYLRLQPVLAKLPAFPTPTNAGAVTPEHLFFLILLIDPTHGLTHHTMSQPLPRAWLDIPFEENEWVEEFMVDAIRGATEVVAQEYITGRMRAQTNAIEDAREQARQALEQHEIGSRTAEDGATATAEGDKEREVSTISQEARVGVV
ncbi:uncharacterized protein JCM15063_005730 [Sporobolomyces koalae]|uniref:uncharacterized protein n=1 Tax=Sporobolomyces koalae TaxID=500713 RepID=UPI00317FA921